MLGPVVRQDTIYIAFSLTTRKRETFLLSFAINDITLITMGFTGMKALNLGVVPEHWRLDLPYVEGWVPAGFPSPASDYEARELDLVEHLIRNRAATFLMRAVGHSMREAGIFD